MYKQTGFIANELTLPYKEWCTLVRERYPQLSTEVKEWLRKWDDWDLALSPMNDDNRRYIRRGHYLGWFTGRIYKEEK